MFLVVLRDKAGREISDLVPNMADLEILKKYGHYQIIKCEILKNPLKVN